MQAGDRHLYTGDFEILRIGATTGEDGASRKPGMMRKSRVWALDPYRGKTLLEGMEKLSDVLGKTSKCF